VERISEPRIPPADTGSPDCVRLPPHFARDDTVGEVNASTNDSTSDWLELLLISYQPSASISTEKSVESRSQGTEESWEPPLRTENRDLTPATECSQMQKILHQLLAGVREHAFRVELHALDREFPVAQAHDHARAVAFYSVCTDFEIGG
jgi:hypothetical protein